MDIFSGFILGFEQILSVSGVITLVLGVLLGIMAGATPGISPAMAVALLVPFSFGMEPATAFILFVAVYQAANYGGSITAIVINTPGTASSAVTAIDGHELTKKGKVGKALSSALCSSVFGGIVGAIILILFSVPASIIAVKFGPLEYLILALFGILTVILFAGKSKLKSFIAVILGMLLATIGIDSFTGQSRFTFGLVDLLDGVSLIPAMIGLFALAEVFIPKEKNNKNIEIILEKSEPVLFYLKYYITQIKSSLIGTFIGILPGAGATVASFISYAEAKRVSKKKENFGSGEVEGIVASEAANSSSVGGALIPLLALGIPGSATDAVLLGALTLHGLVAGPALFQKAPEVVYGIFISVLLANLLILIFGKLFNKVWVNISKVNSSFLSLVIVLLCVLGSYSLKNSIFDCYLCIAFGLIGVVLKKYKVPLAAVILGLVLGSIVEENLRRIFLIYP